MKYKNYVKKHKNEVRTLNVWDVDDTLGKTAARVTVMKDGKLLKVLDPGEFNKYQLKSGESFDFSQFRSGKIFRDTFKPINTVLDRAKEIVWNQTENSRSIILTARADFEDHKEFLQAFRDHGFPIDHVYVERAGNISNLRPSNPASAHISKGVVLRKYLKTGNYDRVRMWDDHERNLDILYKVAAQFPNVEAIGYLVKNGRVTKYKPELQKKKTTEVVGSIMKETVRNKVYEEQ